MSSPAVPLLVDARGNPISSRSYGTGFSQSNHLIQAATQNNDRKRIADLDKDPHRNVSNVGRRTLMTLGRWLWSNFPVIRGTVKEMADLTAAQLIPQFYGADQAWGEAAETLLIEHDKICDVAGPPYDMASNRRSLIISTIRDGDRGTVLVDNGQGYPLMQVIPAHRIQSPGGISGEQFVKGGPYDGARIIDGVVVDDIGRAIAYRVVSGWDGSGETYIPARDFILSFEPDYDGQVRGFSQLGAIIFDMMDVQESRQFELTAQKLAASIGLVETNETGTADPAKSIMGEAPSLNDDGTKATTRTEQVDGVMIRYFRAGTGSKLDTHRADRPTQNQRDFEHGIIRAAIHALGWSIDFSLDPTKVGGNQGRVVVDKINRRIGYLRDRVILPSIRRFDQYRISKFIQLGLIPKNDEWWKWEYQPGKRLTGDERYQSDVAIQEVSAGFKSMRQAIGDNGSYWRDVVNDKAEEADYVFARADALAKKYNVSFQEALAQIANPAKSSSMSITAGATPEPARPAASSEDEA